MRTVDSIDQSASRRHWDAHLDPNNLEKSRAQRDFESEWEFYFSDEARFAVRHFPNLQGAKCLELGAGLGTFALWMAKQGATVFAVDFSFARLKALKQSAREMNLEDRIHCFQCAAENLPIVDGTVALVYTKSVLIHTRLPQALTEARRVLASQGRAVFVEPLGANPFAGFVRRFFAPQSWKAFTRYFDEWSAAEVAKVFPGATRRPFYLFGFLAFLWQFKWHHVGLFRFALNVARPLDRLLFVFPPLRRLAWFNVFVCWKDRAK